MAKMFYTLDEAADKLGVDEQQVKEMVAGGQLQQFRDGSKLMFKRDQVDSLAGGGDDAANLDDTGGPIDLADSSAGTSAGTSGGSVGPISLADTGESDAISLSDTDAGATSSGRTAAGTRANDRTGVSVFDADEVDAADPMAQTQVTNVRHEDEEIALESVGSGSGLLDLTRESDDTSLGAELLDEIYPGSESGGSKMGSAAGASGVFESALGTDAGASAVGAPSGLSGMGAGTPIPQPGPTTGVLPAAYDIEDVDPAWSGFSAGALMAAIIALILGLIVVASAIGGGTGPVTDALAGWGFWVILAGLIVLAAILGGIGAVVGKSAR